MRAVIPAAFAALVAGCGSGDSPVTAPSVGAGAARTHRVTIDVSVRQFGASLSVRPGLLVIDEGDNVDFVFTAPSDVECGLKFNARGRIVPDDIDADDGNHTERRRFLAADWDDPFVYTVRCLIVDRFYTAQGVLHVF